MKDPRDRIVELQMPILKILKKLLPTLRGTRARRELMMYTTEILALLKTIEKVNPPSKRLIDKRNKDDDDRIDSKGNRGL